MNERPDSSDEAVAAAVAAAGALLDVPGVEGVGRGETEAGDPAVLVLCSGITAELRAALPADVAGVPVVLYDIGERPTAFDSTAEMPDIEPDCS